MASESAQPLPELEVANVFRWADYDVQQAVGVEPGTVDWFAVPRTGFERPKTYFTVWPTAPVDLSGAVEALEQRRRSLGADRAVAVVKGGAAPASAADVNDHVQVLTLRRLVLELSGIADEVRDFVRRYEPTRGPWTSFGWKGRANGEAAVNAIEYLEAWVDAGPKAPLWLASEDKIGFEIVTEEARYRVGKRFVENPDVTTPMLPISLLLLQATQTREKLIHEAFLRGWALQLRHEIGPGEPPTTPCIYVVDRPISSFEGSSFVISRPSSQEFETWFGEQLGEDARLRRALLEATRTNEHFRIIVESTDDADLVLAALKAVGPPRESASLQEWLARVIASYMDELKQADSEWAAFSPPMSWPVWPEVAMEDFALARVSQSGAAPIISYLDRHSSIRRGRFRGPPWPDRLKRWLHLEVDPKDAGLFVRGFANRLVRDYFVAERIVTEVQAGKREILTRYQFPRDYVLLFLAILSPDVVATATADRREEMRAEVEGEVERRLQLTLAHQLKRSVGAIRSDIKQIRRQWEAAFPSEGAAPGAAGAESFARIEQELTYQSSLAEQTRLWGEVPNGEVERLPLSSLVDEVVRPLRGQFPSVRWEVSIAEHLATRASRAAVREILHCLIENAAHAAAFFEAEKSTPAHVSITARELGDTVRVEVVDSGPGVHPDDRERIFDPYVTTKKGGPGRPLGTGLGLAIARRYAGHIGARVGLEADRKATCFFAIFVAHRPQPEEEV